MKRIWRLECRYNDNIFYFTTKEKAEEWLARRGEEKSDYLLEWWDISDDN